MFLAEKNRLITITMLRNCGLSPGAKMHFGVAQQRIT